VTVRILHNHSYSGLLRDPEFYEMQRHRPHQRQVRVQVGRKGQPW